MLVVEEENTTAPPLAIASIIIGMAFMATASGAMFTFLPIRLAGLGFESWVAGTMITAVALGGFVGCMVTGYLVRNSGHARVFATLIAVVIISFLLLAVITNVWVWLGSRFIYGAAMNGLFIVAQSWLHDASSDRWRGRVMAIFYMTYVLCIGAGSLMMGYVDFETQTPMMLAILFATISILPIGLTRLPQPPPPPQGTISIGKVWRIAPVGLVGMFTVGGLTMMIQGFAPIWATDQEMSQSQVALMMSLMQVGMLFVQLPLGALSDHVDRRLVLVATCAIIGGAALFAFVTPGLGFVFVVLVFAIWSGATETIYSVSNALANDQADPSDYVMLSSTLLFAWSVSAFVIPFMGTIATAQFGTTAFMWITAVAAGVFGLFVIYRMFVRRYDPAEETETFVPATATVPYQIEPFESEEYAAGFWTESVG